MSKRTLILGLGNTILRDDRIGLDIARIVYKGLNQRDCDLVESQLVGANILDFICGYKVLIITDSIKTKGGRVGDIYELSLDDLPKQRRINSPHEAGLYWTIQMGRRLGMDIPDEIRIYAIEVDDPFNFGEGLTDSMKGILAGIAGTILEKEKTYARSASSP